MSKINITSFSTLVPCPYNYRQQLPLFSNYVLKALSFKCQEINMKYLSYRTTEAYRAGFYDIISNLYGMEDMRAFNLSEFGVPDITLDHLYYDFGHNKSDLIFR